VDRGDTGSIRACYGGRASSSTCRRRSPRVWVRSIESIRRDRPWVGAVFVWNLNFRTFQDYHKSETAIFGFLNEDWSPRALFNAVKSLVRPG
jgi:hypothetical protein